MYICIYIYIYMLDLCVAGGGGQSAGAACSRQYVYFCTSKASKVSTTACQEAVRRASDSAFVLAICVLLY